VEALNTPTIRRLTPSCRHQLSALAPGRRASCAVRSLPGGRRAGERGASLAVYAWAMKAPTIALFVTKPAPRKPIIGRPCPGLARTSKKKPRGLPEWGSTTRRKSPSLLMRSPPGGPQKENQNGRQGQNQRTSTRPRHLDENRGGRTTRRHREILQRQRKSILRPGSAAFCATATSTRTTAPP
jgi:hypothetical protein